jgi:ribonucleoside-triphosphate reductase class III catalytic subunit (EC 1.17.4.2)
MSVLWEGCEQVKDENTIEKVINQGTLGIGFIGLAEALVALVGKHHGEDDKLKNSDWR